MLFWRLIVANVFRELSSACCFTLSGTIRISLNAPRLVALLWLLELTFWRTTLDMGYLMMDGKIFSNPRDHDKEHFRHYERKMKEAGWT